MSKKVKISIADQFDNKQQLMAFGSLILSLIFAIRTSVYFVDFETGETLGTIARILLFLLIVIILALISWRTAVVRKYKCSFWPSDDSFVMQVRNKALVISWTLTFVFLSFILETTGRYDSDFPAKFYLNLTTFFMLAVFSVSFFFLFRTSDNDALSPEETE